MKKLVALFALALLCSVAVIGMSVYEELSKGASEDPKVWEEDISDLVAKTEANAPADDAVLFVGSSSIRLWSTLAEDMAPLTVIQHGFGGAKIQDVNYFSEQLITRWNAPKVVIFVGTNNINGNEQHAEAPTYIRDQLQLLLDTILTARPNTEVFYIEITPTIFSWDKWASVQEANALAKALIARYPQVKYISTTDLFLTDKGEPDKKLYRFDGLHLSADGYERWTSRIKPLLMK